MQITLETLGGHAGLYPPLPESRVAVAGADSPRLARLAGGQDSKLAIAGVNCKNLYYRSKMGVVSEMTSWTRRNVAGKLIAEGQAQSKLATAGNPTSTIRRNVSLEFAREHEDCGIPQTPEERRYIGNRIQSRGLEAMCWLLDWQYLFCTLEGKMAKPGQRATELLDPDNGWTIVWRDQFEEMFGPADEARGIEGPVMDLYLDAGSYREFTGTAEYFYGLKSYYKAIDLGRPKGWMHKDVVGSNQVSLGNYLQMVWDGYGDGWNGEGCIPVWQVGECWDPTATVHLGPEWNTKNDSARRMIALAIANARKAARDPILLFYASRHNLVAIGGMIVSKIPRAARGYYLAELGRCLSAAVGYTVMVWGLGQASENVVNQLREIRLENGDPALKYVWLDSTWWIHNARNMRIPFIMKDTGLIKSHDYSKMGADIPFTLGQMMIAQLRCLQGAWLDIYAFPDALPLPVDVRDLDQLKEIKRMMEPTLQLDLFRRGIA